jgi:hypothetical protein
MMAELFQTTPQNIRQHLREIYAEGELDDAATCTAFLQARAGGARQVLRKLQQNAGSTSGRMRTCHCETACGPPIFGGGGAVGGGVEDVHLGRPCIRSTRSPSPRRRIRRPLRPRTYLTGRATSRRGRHRTPRPGSSRCGCRTGELRPSPVRVTTTGSRRR